MAALRPPYTLKTAHEKVKFAQNMWNSCNPAQVSNGYTSDCIWRNRASFIRGTAQIVDLLTKKWDKEKSYRLRKELFAFTDDKIAVQFWYEYQDKYDGMKWKRCYGLEDWTFDRESGKMRKRQMSGNDILLGKDGDGVAVPEEGIQGRWFVDGVDVDDDSVTAKITEAHW
ncbi:uncharacterized protein PV07_07331 [Cladophialophora immunda]|uniref:DUF1348-domain-containing protein n=1 Tax=Cladophialophora immunda TaxID=569365 RepID=A0A0D2CB03_9EURO|nr:uncharacterized protein PV07_07331 [Cladophialophora immunda]KIW27605.1 hypothetical protein PV07_07331 [Cladophialophora immunda]OQU97343.1 hypothetical protein CLAIMM_03287 [Cladophialophora immunda]